MLTEDYVKWATERKIKFPRGPQLTLTFNAEGILLSTPMLKYYLESGMVVSKLYYFVEYAAQTPFRSFVDKMVGKRIEATKSGDKLSQNMSKMLMNSSWGRLGKLVFRLPLLY